MRGFLRMARAIAMRCRCAAAQFDPALAHQGVVAVRHCGDEVVRIGCLRGGFDLFLRGVQLAVADVVAHVAAEERRLLRHDADLLAQAAHLDVADVAAVDRDAAFGRVVEARDQVDQRRLAGAARPDQRDHLAGPGGQIDLAQHRARLGVILVIERHVVEADQAFDGRQRLRVGVVCHLGRRAEQLEHPVAGADRLLELRVQRRERADRRGNHQGVEQEGDQLARRQLRRRSPAGRRPRARWRWSRTPGSR